ncbi:39S ribosomal protein L40, mitochondrial [Armadillidium vulgare]|nr:39S ribosomal protein L40, mitochondrial [Armadillidium vulgare]
MMSLLNSSSLKFSRKRLIPKLSLEEEIRRRRIERRWCQYKNEQHQEDFININKAIKASERAELKEVSEDLYMEAIQLDLQLLPFRCEGPLRTPPVEGYEATDGDYKDITKKWE